MRVGQYSAKVLAIKNLYLLPALLALAWYAPRPGQADPWDDTESARQPADLRSGEVWRMVVRLKAPHGGRNPHGFDQELWLWEQGIQAVGHVRSGPRDAPPQRLQAAGWNVDGLRQSVRSAIEARVSDASLAGVLSALVMGDRRLAFDWVFVVCGTFTLYFPAEFGLYGPPC